MTKPFFYILVCFLTTAEPSFCQGKLKFDQLPVTTQNGFKQIASKYHSGEVDYLSVENDLKKSGIDFSKMSVEDAVMMMFMLISEDARKDMKEMLDDMEATRQKRSAMREAETLMKKEMASLRSKAGSKYDSLQTKEEINVKTIKVKEYSSREEELIAYENKIAIKRASAEKHLKSAEAAIYALQQLQTRKKSQ
ncbi:MAG: hypothetical protein WCH29_07955 [Chitinophagaceae bacterium]